MLRLAERQQLQENTSSTKTVVKFLVWCKTTCLAWWICQIQSASHFTFSLKVCLCTQLTRPPEARLLICVQKDTCQTLIVFFWTSGSGVRNRESDYHRLAAIHQQLQNADWGNRQSDRGVRVRPTNNLPCEALRLSNGIASPSCNVGRSSSIGLPDHRWLAGWPSASSKSNLRKGVCQWGVRNCVGARNAQGPPWWMEWQLGRDSQPSPPPGGDTLSSCTLLSTNDIKFSRGSMVFETLQYEYSWCLAVCQVASGACEGTEQPRLSDKELTFIVGPAEICSTVLNKAVWQTAFCFCNRDKLRKRWSGRRRNRN